MNYTPTDEAVFGYYKTHENAFRKAEITPILFGIIYKCLGKPEIDQTTGLLEKIFEINTTMRTQGVDAETAVKQRREQEAMTLRQRFAYRGPSLLKIIEERR